MVWEVSVVLQRNVYVVVPPTGLTVIVPLASPAQARSVFDMVEYGASVNETANVTGAPSAQPLFSTTITSAGIVPHPQSTVMLLVPCPPVMVPPVTVHVNTDPPAGVTEYVSPDDRAHTELFPVMGDVTGIEHDVVSPKAYSPDKIFRFDLRAVLPTAARLLPLATQFAAEFGRVSNLTPGCIGNVVKPFPVSGMEMIAPSGKFCIAIPIDSAKAPAMVTEVLPASTPAKTTPTAIPSGIL